MENKVGVIENWKKQLKLSSVILVRNFRLLFRLFRHCRVVFVTCRFASEYPSIEQNYLYAEIC